MVPWKNSSKKAGSIAGNKAVNRRSEKIVKIVIRLLCETPEPHPAFVVVTTLLGNVPCFAFDRDFRALGLRYWLIASALAGAKSWRVGQA
jgi:hypothetical protein